MATETLGVRVKATDEASSVLNDIRGHVKGLRTSFAELNGAVQLARVGFNLVERVIGGTARAIVGASEAAAGNTVQMDAVRKAIGGVNMAFGDVVNKSGALTSFYEGITQLATALSEALSDATIDGGGFKSAVETVIIPAIKEVVVVGLQTIKGFTDAIGVIANAVSVDKGGFAHKALLGVSMIGGAAASSGAKAMLAFGGMSSSLATTSIALDETIDKVKELQFVFRGEQMGPHKPKDGGGKTGGAKSRPEGPDAFAGIDAISTDIEAMKARQDEIAAVNLKAWQARFDSQVALGLQSSAWEIENETNKQNRITEIANAAQTERANSQNAAIQQAFGAMLSASSKAFGQLVTTGKVSGKQFAAGILGGVGTAAEGLGTMMIFAGSGLQQLMSGNFVGGIAFGAALVALGAALQGASGLIFGGGKSGGGARASGPDFGAAGRPDVGPGRSDPKSTSINIIVGAGNGSLSDHRRAVTAADLRDLLESGAAQITHGGTPARVTFT